jgi:hypothetical protein
MGLTRDLEIPEHLLSYQRTGDEFDVNAYFFVLSHLSVEPGYILDYVYGGDRPFIYALEEDEPRYLTRAEYSDAFGEDAWYAEHPIYLDHIQVDGTEEGFFEFVVLSLMEGQFYLQGHAFYNDDTVVCDPTGVEAVLKAAEHVLPSETDSWFADAWAVFADVWVKALELDLKPRVELSGDAAVVKVVVFSKWGGFREETYTISQDFPHTILDHETKTLVPYDCGILF